MSWLAKYFRTGYRFAQQAGVPVAAEQTINFVSGATVVDNPTAQRTDVTITPASATPAVNVEDEGTPLSGNPHATLNFVGSGVTATDAGGGVAQISIPGSSGLDFQNAGVGIANDPHTTVNILSGGVFADAGGGVASLTISASGTAFGAFSGRPAAGNSGHVYYVSDGPISFVDDGTIWRPLIGSYAGSKQPTAAASFTQFNAGGSSTTLADDKGCLKMSLTNGDGGEDIRVAVVSTPGSTWTLTANMALLYPPGNSFLAGMALRQSSNGSVELFLKRFASVGGDNWARHRATASGTGGSPSYSFNHEDTVYIDNAFNAVGWWLQMQNDGMNVVMRVSENGFDWVDLFTESVGAFITPDQLGFCLFSSAGGTNKMSLRVHAMTLTTP